MKKLLIVSVAWMVAPIRFIEPQKQNASRRGHSYVVPKPITYEDDLDVSNSSRDEKDDKRMTAIADGNKCQRSDKESVNNGDKLEGEDRENALYHGVVNSITNVEGKDYGRHQVEEKAHRFIILPHSKFRSSWDIYVCVLLLYVATFLPYQVSFFKQDYQGVIKHLEVFIDTSFGIDIVLNFFTGEIDFFSSIIKKCAIRLIIIVLTTK